MSLATTSRMKSICVLGGTGFVGRQLTRALVERGYRVTVPTRNRRMHESRGVNQEVSLIEGDVHDIAFLRRVVGDSEAVINLVGILNEQGHDGSGFRHAHTELARRLASVCSETGVTRILQMSALKADAANGASHYLRTKGQAELELKRQGESSLECTIFRPSVIFGPEDSFINRFAKLLRLSPVLPLPRLDARFAPVYVADVVSAFCTALQSPDTIHRTYELCGPDVWAFREIIDYIKSELGIRRIVIEMPDALGWLQACVAEYLVPGRPFSLDNFRSLSVASVCSGDGLRALGIEATPMTAVVPEYLRGNR